MKSRRLLSCIVFFSICSFTYLHAQSVKGDCSVQPCQTAVAALPSVAEDGCLEKDENPVTSENFLASCLKKLVNAVSISATLQQDVQKEEEKPSCLKKEDI